MLNSPKSRIAGIFAGALALALVLTGRAVAQDTVAATFQPTDCISTVHTCVSVPVVFSRTDTTGMRGYSVTLQLSANLALCGSITRGSYLTSANPNTKFIVTDLGGGSYLVDEVILGVPCGATGSGTLFTIPLTSSSPGGIGTVSITSVTARNCDNDSVPAFAGLAGSIKIDNVPPAAVTNLASSQVKSGNDPDSTTRVTLTFTNPEAGTSISIYRAGYGSYPTYAGGSVPAAPTAYPASGPWALTGVSATGQTDKTPARNFYYFVAITRDSCDNATVSNLTSGTLNYFLGDYANGVSPGSGDNAVNTTDLSLLGAHYGLSGVAVAPYSYLDVGPTTNRSVNSRPVPDTKIGFEDLILLSINFETVSKPSMARDEALPAGSDELSLRLVGDAPVGGVLRAAIGMRGTGHIQGLSARLRWNPAAVTPSGISAGELLESQGGVALSAEPGVVDAVLQGVSRRGLTGEGTLASVSFRRIAEGDPGLSLASVDARDSRNQTVELGMVQPNVRPAVTGLAPASPNPSRGGATLRYSLAKAGQADLAIFSVDGRKVRQLASGSRGAGSYEAAWNGRDNGGRPVAPGIYYARLQTQQGSFTRTLTLLN